MIKKNDERIGIVCDYGSEGEGVIKDEGIVIFVPFALLGEKIKYKVLKVTKTIAFAKLLEVLEASPFRTKALCPVFGKCGGCQYQHLEYNKQLEIKKKSIENAFSKIAFLDVKCQNPVCGESPFRYRNKLQLPISQVGDKTYIGFYAENSHRVVEISDCIINAYWTKELIVSLKSYMQEFNLKGYDENANKGDLREITAREIEGKLIITLVSLRKNLPCIEKFISLLQANIKKEFSLFINVNKKSTNQIYGDEFVLVYGPREYKGEMLGVKFSMGVQSFMQVNSSVCEKLYSTVNTLLSTKENSVVIDAYSGAGLMTALLSKNVSRAIGIEIISEAVELANQLAIDNGLEDKIKNYNGKCEEIMPDIIAQERQKNSEIYLVLDPPRKGCDLSVIKSIIKSDIDKIVYVSCKPSTLARDVGLLVGTLKEDNGKIVKVDNPTYRYNIQTVIPFEMFPQTKHIETVICIEKRNNFA